MFMVAMAFVLDALAADAVVHMVRHLAHWSAARLAPRVPVPVYVYEDPDLPPPVPEHAVCSGCDLEGRFLK
jgi:hypothetical protein